MLQHFRLIDHAPETPAAHIRRRLELLHTIFRPPPAFIQPRHQISQLTAITTQNGKGTSQVDAIHNAHQEKRTKEYFY
ncbi:hypothetical protein AA0472_2068 [Acetobacter estunensis NRIC 0472]|nr:hypothetical protein AA0472_2068 [Acetobacter estunensis NRIC 0472]